MSTIENTSNNHNKDYDDVEICTPEGLIDTIFDLMVSNKYINQAITKFDDFIIKSHVTFFDISKNDLSDKTKKQIDEYIKCCKTNTERYDRLDGIIVDVIALIYNQSKPRILSSLKFQDKTSVERSINEIRTSVSKKWMFV